MQHYKSPTDVHEIFDLFIQKGASVNAKNRNGEAPLHKAIFNNAIRLILVYTNTIAPSKYIKG